MRRRSLNALETAPLFSSPSTKIPQRRVVGDCTGFLSLFLSLYFSFSLALPQYRTYTYNVFEQLRRIFGVAIVAGVGGPRGGIIRSERVRASSRANE